MTESVAILETREKIRKWLTEELGPVETLPDGSLSFRWGSAQVFIDVETLSDELEDETVVRVVAPLLFNVPPSPELYEWVARAMNNYRFGAFVVVDDEEAPGNLRLLHTVALLGTKIDLEEFKMAWIASASTADDVDDELQAKFGGEKFYDD
jgi:hypothetical protein